MTNRLYISISRVYVFVSVCVFVPLYVYGGNRISAPKNFYKIPLGFSIRIWFEHLMYVLILNWSTYSHLYIRVHCL